MPELPEVEIRRRYLTATSLQQPITNILVEDTKLLTVSYSHLLEALVGRQFTDTRRVGKNLFVLTEGPGADARGDALSGASSPGVIVHLHFGMTGDLEYYHASLDRPRFARIVFEFDSGFNLGFLCPRKFERVGIVTDIDAYLRRKKIAPDGLVIALADFAGRVRRRKSLIKPVLLDQQTVAGLGNWIVDEVLFQARIHPEKIADSLTDNELITLHKAMILVLETAIRCEANYRDFPKSFLTHVREWDTSPYNDPDAHRFCPRDSTRIERKTVGGRTTFFCPMCQQVAD